MDHESPTPRTDDSLEGLLDAFQNLELNPDDTFTEFYQTHEMAENTTTIKKTKLNPPKILRANEPTYKGFFKIPLSF